MASRSRPGAAKAAPPSGGLDGGERSVGGRDLVGAVQRRRIVAAMIEAACERGAARVTVGQIVARSGVSRRTFYEQFASGEECLLAALEHGWECARERVLAAYDPTAPWQARMRAGLAALLVFLEEERAIGRLLVVESLAAGPRVLERRARALTGLIEAVDAGRAQGRRDAGGGRPSALTAEALVGSVLAVLHARLRPGAGAAEAAEGGRGGSLLELCSPLMSMIVRPYLSGAAATRELARPAPVPASAGGAGGGDGADGGAGGLGGIGFLSELPMRLTYRTTRVLRAVAEQPGGSNRQIGNRAGVYDQGQISKLLARLRTLGLVENDGGGPVRGAPNAWRLSRRGVELARALGGTEGAAPS